jgi:hypothetical protein
MSQLDEEIAGIMARQMAKELEENQSSLEEISRVLARLPYDEKELRVVREAVDMWHRDGHAIAFGPLSSEFHFAPAEDKMRMARDFLTRGLMFVSAFGPHVELMIVKVDAGKGFFGGQKVRYACYMSGGDGRYSPIGDVGIVVMAVTKLSPVLRAYGAI